MISIFSVMDIIMGSWQFWFLSRIAILVGITWIAEMVWEEEIRDA